MQTTLTHPKLIATITLSKGDILNIDGITFPVTEDCKMRVKGVDTSEGYADFQIAECGGVIVSQYVVECPAITLHDLQDQFVNDRRNELGEKEVWMDTWTDIGGHYITVNQQIVAFLRNGFGDGRYTLRFREGSHYRS